MKRVLVFMVAALVALLSFSQNQQRIQKSWIKIQAETMSDDKMDADILYTWYSFGQTKLYKCFYFGWNGYEQDWAMRGDTLLVGAAAYKIESLTDTSLILIQSGHKRLKFLSEEYVSNQDINLVFIREYGGKPLYKATEYVFPKMFEKRYIDQIHQKCVDELYKQKADYFTATFVVTEMGEVEDVQVVKGISEQFDREIAEKIAESSRHWKPAFFKGKAIQTEVVFEVKSSGVVR